MGKDRIVATPNQGLILKRMSRGRSFTRSALWIVHMLQPGTPLASKLEEWRHSLRKSRKATDPRSADDLARPRSLLAKRFAEHYANVACPETDADQWTAGIGLIVCDGEGLVQLRNAVMGMIELYGFLPRSYGSLLLIVTARETLEQHDKSRIVVYERLHAILESITNDPDAIYTQKGLVEEALRKAGLWVAA